MQQGKGNDKKSNMKKSACTLGLIFLLFFTSNAQSDDKKGVGSMDTIPVLVFSPGDSVIIAPKAFFYYDNEKVVNGPESWQLTDFTLKYCLVPHKEEERVVHSDDWFSQQRLAEHLCTLTQEELEIFVRTFLFTESDWEELGEMKEK